MGRKRLGIFMLALAILVITGCGKEPELEGEKWEVSSEIFTGKEDPQRKRDIMSYVTVVVEMEDGVIDAEVITDEVTEEDKEIEGMVKFAGGMYASIDFERSYEIDGDTLIIHPYYKAKEYGNSERNREFKVKWEDKDTVILEDLINEQREDIVMNRNEE